MRVRKRERNFFGLNALNLAVEFEQWLAKAGALLECPMEIIQVELNDKTLPCYFIPAKKDKVCPVMFLVTGGEGSNIEMYFWMRACALKNGYSVFWYEGSGNFSIMYTKRTANTGLAKVATQ